MAKVSQTKEKKTKKTIIFVIIAALVTPFSIIVPAVNWVQSTNPIFGTSWNLGLSFGVYCAFLTYLIFFAKIYIKSGFNKAEENK